MARNAEKMGMENSQANEKPETDQPKPKGGPFKYGAWVLILAAVVIIGWMLVKQLAPEKELILSPMLICTGVDTKGIPIGVSDVYTQEQVQETGVTAFLTYSGAVPRKTTFQMRWTIDGKTYQSAVRPFENEMDFIQVNLGKELPPGNHVIEFLVDGKVMRNASMTIEAAAEEPDPPVQRARRKRPRSTPAQESHQIPYEAPSSQ